MRIGLLHPGEMGASLGAVLRSAGHEALWASAGRSAATRERAASAGLADADDLGQLVETSDVIVAVCPPHAAVQVATDVARHSFTGVYVDANAVAPSTAAEVEAVVTAAGAGFVDGGIIGGPVPATGRASSTRLYLAGSRASEVAGLFPPGPPGPLGVVVLPPGLSASALKMVYAAYTKGVTALLVAVRHAAQALEVEDALLAEWALSQPELPARSDAAAKSAGPKAWRFVGEMEEIASTFSSVGLPEGFHVAAAEVYRRLSQAPLTS